MRTDLGVVAITVPWVLQGRGWSWKKGCGAEGAVATEVAGRAADEILPATRAALPSPPAERRYADAA